MAEFIKNPQNTIIFGLIALFVTLYGVRLSPKLPDPVLKLFENKVFRAVVIFFIVYMADHDIHVSLLVTIAFMIITNSLQNSNMFETFLQNYERNMEGFNNLPECESNDPLPCPKVQVSESQKKKLNKGEIECVDSLKQWFGCQGDNPITVKQNKSVGNCYPVDNISKKMLKLSQGLADGSKKWKSSS